MAENMLSFICAALALFSLPAYAQVPCNNGTWGSQLWGCSGERYSPARLPDFSYAGFAANDVTIPNLPLGVNVLELGAKGDGVFDNSAVFALAVQFAPAFTTIFVPPGTFVLKSPLTIDKPVVLRGSGMQQTTLMFPRSLTDVYGNPGLATNASSYAFGFGNSFVNLHGRYTASFNIRVRSNITANAERGTFRLFVSNASAMSVGQWVRLTMDDPGNGTLGLHMNADLTRADPRSIGVKELVRFSSRVRSVNSSFIELERALPFSVNTAWNPAIWNYDVFPVPLQGIENLSIRFPVTNYRGRGTELGYNALNFMFSHNAWARNISIINADIAISFNRASFTTIENVTLSSTRGAINNTTGGLGFFANIADNIRICGFNINTSFVSDVFLRSVLHSVLCNGTAHNLNLDFNVETGQNLFSRINVGVGNRLWVPQSTGFSAAYNTFWNLESSSGTLMPLTNNAVSLPAANFIATMVNLNLTLNRWFENVSTASLVPKDLFSSQLARSTTRLPRIPLVPGPFMRYTSPGYRCDGAGNVCGLTNTSCRHNPSSLYGCRGERWNAGGRLLDYSYAGFNASFSDLPRTKPWMCNVKDFGAVGDNATDDTGAILSAINRCAGFDNASTVYFPAGSYVISNRVSINKNVILAGAGRDVTRLYFPRSLGDIDGVPPPPANGSVVPGSTSPYSYGDAIISIDRWFKSDVIAVVTANSTRGASIVRVNSTSAFRDGTWYQLLQDEVRGALLSVDLFNGCSNVLPSAFANGRASSLRLLVRVQVLNGTALRLERWLPWNVSLAFNARFISFGQFRPEGTVGIENITFQFAHALYGGHWRERGYNALQIGDGITNAWIRSVRVLNSDIGITVQSQFTTVRDVVIDVTSSRINPVTNDSMEGHIGIGLPKATDTVLENFTIATWVYHSVFTSMFSDRVVVKNGRPGKGVELSLDHHGKTPYGVLWTNISAGLGYRWHVSGGDYNDGGPNTAAFSTFWNVQTRLAVDLPRDGRRFGGTVNVVGVNSFAPMPPNACSWWGENPPNVYPWDLHAAMVRNRRSAITESEPVLLS